MYELKTKETDHSVMAFIENVDNPADIDIEVLKDLIKQSIQFLRETYPD